jgi:transcription antitermination protein NusB
MGARRKARECALQMLFAYDVARPAVNDLVETYWGEMAESGEDVKDFANELAVGTIAHLTEIDERIRIRTEHWRISRMAIVDRNLLRMAVYEFLHQDSTPRTVAINEALEIARRFSTHEATQFINGILDAIKRDLDTQVPAKAIAKAKAPVEEAPEEIIEKEIVEEVTVATVGQPN